MKHNDIASIEGKNTTLCNIDNTASIRFIMPQVEILMEAVCQPITCKKRDAFKVALL